MTFVVAYYSDHLGDIDIVSYPDATSKLEAVLLYIKERLKIDMSYLPEEADLETIECDIVPNWDATIKCVEI